MDSLLRLRNHMSLRSKKPKRNQRKKRKTNAVKHNDKQKMQFLKEIRTRYNSHPFYSSEAWLKLRYRALANNGRRCQACGAEGLNIKLHVDHIKPRSRFPELQFDINNLQVLCEACNLGKGNWDETDWRKRP